MKLLTLTLAVFAFSISYGQITTTKVAEAAKSNVPEKKYDSTENFLNDNVQLYIGQEFYLKGMPENLREYGYDNLVIDYTKNKFEKGNVYRPGSSLGSKYEDLVGRYFTVLDVIKSDQIGTDYFLKLQAKESKDILYYGYNTNNTHDFPFIVAGYYLKAKQTLIGKKYVVRDFGTSDRVDMNTGLIVSGFTSGNIWSVSDITVEEKFYKVSVVLENSKHEKTLLDIDDLKSDFFVIDYDKMIKCHLRPGDAYWKLVAGGDVVKGMSNAVCELSWGKADDITKKTYNGEKLELWSYKHGELYFKDGVLFSIKHYQF